MNENRRKDTNRENNTINQENSRSKERIDETFENAIPVDELEADIKRKQKIKKVVQNQISQYNL